MARAVWLAALAVVGLGGCTQLEGLRPDSDLAQVPTSPFAPTAVHTAKRSRLNFTPAAQDVAWQVDAVGRKLLSSNPQAGLQPLFATIGGAAEPEIFHSDLSMVYVTETLARQCHGEAELAAVLASELGKMIAQREAATARSARVAEPALPIGLPVGGQGNPLAADPTYFVEIAKYDREHPKAARAKALPPPDPRRVARTLLEKAGYAPADLDTVAPVLAAAERHCTLERQFKGVVAPDAGISWRPH